MDGSTNGYNGTGTTVEDVTPSYGNQTDVCTGKTYYGVCIPSEAQVCEGQKGVVLTDTLEALKLVKKYKKARFKAFEYYHEAEEFAARGSDTVTDNPAEVKSPPVKKAQELISAEKCQFRGPKSQDLVKLRKAIENGDTKFVDEIIWENPRYLISSGDTPSILQEGFRYNALHVAAKAKNHEIAELLLNTISNVNFYKLLYGDDEHQDPEERVRMLLDLYLNTPDKGLNETPLHFAVKYGAVKVVEVFVSFSKCDKNVRNKYGKLPNQIICDRYEGSDISAVKSEISTLLEDRYYVPVLRSEDNCTSPIVGEPFSPISPPDLNRNAKHPRLEIHAYAGPLTRESAEKFRKVWKTPPRVNRLAILKNNRLIMSEGSLDKVSVSRLKNHEKGLEIVGRDLAKKYKIEWKEYWPFLSDFANFTSQEGMQQLELYLKKRNERECLDNCTDRASTDSGKFSNHIYRSDQQASPVSTLCNSFEMCTLTGNGITCKLAYDHNQKLPVGNFTKDGQNAILKPEVSPFLCVERSCQVFAHRIVNDIIYMCTFQRTVRQNLRTQMKCFEQLIVSYIEDDRFSNINFNTVHYRLAVNVAAKLKDSFESANQIIDCITKVRDNCLPHPDGFSSDDEEVFNSDKIKDGTSDSHDKHLECVLGFVVDLVNKSNSCLMSVCDTEEICREASNDSDRCLCTWAVKNTKKNIHNKRSSVKLRKTNMRNSIEMIAKRLNFDNDDDLDDFNNTANVFKDESSSETEDFFTPPTSPSCLRTLSDEEIYEEAELPYDDVFIESDIPTRTDNEVYLALQHVVDKLNPVAYPHIYKWYHRINLFSEEERKSWQVLKSSSSDKFQTPVSSNKREFKSSSTGRPLVKSWLRVTGINSPRASLEEHGANISFNL